VIEEWKRRDGEDVIVERQQSSKEKGVEYPPYIFDINGTDKVGPMGLTLFK
jgi:hypothetical protein